MSGWNLPVFCRSPATTSVRPCLRTKPPERRALFRPAAEYGSQQEILILTGDPRIETASGVMIGTEALIYDLKSRTMRNRGSYRIELKADILKGSTLFNRSTNSSKTR